MPSPLVLRKSYEAYLYSFLKSHKILQLKFCHYSLAPKSKVFVLKICKSPYIIKP